MHITLSIIRDSEGQKGWVIERRRRRRRRRRTTTTSDKYSSLKKHGMPWKIFLLRVLPIPETGTA
jgi:hypothetical protein